MTLLRAVCNVGRPRSKSSKMIVLAPVLPTPCHLSLIYAEFRVVGIAPSLFSFSQHKQLQARTKMTKTKRLRLEKSKAVQKLVDAGIPVTKRFPPKFVPKDREILNASSKETQRLESIEYDKISAESMKTKIQSQGVALRYDFSSLLPEMSDRVKKLFDLTNGSKREIVKAQKAKGMELFQIRDGDTGSSAVQVIALTSRIQQLQTHLTKHKKDNSTKRGLDAIYVRRRKLLDYMERKEFDSYRRVVKTLGLNTK